ncbi:MAG: 16S rRNA (guanine(527)-N(7))-methyltransferase RsmG [Bacteroidales bacterium]|nr:16S rRNA (guanine(527)-N(7))-methyltransferase RsmG [Bacteroidales bacterium]
MNSDLIIRYFPDLSTHQINQFEQLGPLYQEWNALINVISRQDIDNLYERHVLHSLGIAKVIDFKPRTKILDAGTGGGFPGIPLAILFPQAHFHLIDSTAKKLTVVQNIAGETGLNNITTEHSRLEDHRGVYDFIVSRAVTSLPEFSRLVSHLLSDVSNNAISNGILYLKGGDIDKELKSMEAWGHGGMEAGKHSIYPLSDFFTEEFFLTKKVIHIY